MHNEQDIVPTGPASAAFAAAGVGCFALGVFTTLAEVSVGIKNFLNWWDPAGPLAGKSGMAVIVWLVAWAGLHVAWKDRTNGFGSTFALSMFLIALGVVGTFPTFFLLFSH